MWSGFNFYFSAHRKGGSSFLFLILFIFRERGGRRQRGRETLMWERNINWLPPALPRLGAWPTTQARTLNQELNQDPSQADAQSAEPHQPGLDRLFICLLPIWVSTSVSCFSWSFAHFLSIGFCFLSLLICSSYLYVWFLFIHVVNIPPSLWFNHLLLIISNTCKSRKNHLMKPHHWALTIINWHSLLHS